MRILRQIKRTWKTRSGFTVLEMLVVLGISAALSAMFVGHGTNLKDQVALFREEARIIQTLFQAKTFSLQARQIEEGEIACGYGVNFDKEAGDLGVYAKIAGLEDLCPDVDDSADWAYESLKDEMIGNPFRLDETISIGADSAKFIVFAPPQPEVIFTGEEGLVELCSKRLPDFCRTVKVNSVGQITSAK